MATPRKPKGKTKSKAAAVAKPEATEETVDKLEAEITQEMEIAQEVLQAVLTPDSTGKELVAKREVDGRAATQFKPGAAWTGNANGRPKGSRNKINQDTIDGLSLVMDKYSVARIVELVLKTKPEAVLKAIISLLPKQVEVKRPAGEMEDDELLDLLRSMRDAASRASGEGDQSIGEGGEAPGQPVASQAVQSVPKADGVP